MQSKNLTVVLERPLQVVDLEMHGAHARRVGQTESWRRDTVRVLLPQDLASYSHGAPPLEMFHS
jgi:hypothetical protein